MFDMIKCDQWESLIETDKYKDYKFLVLRDCYLKIDMLCDPALLEKILKGLAQLLKNHLKSC